MGTGIDLLRMLEPLVRPGGVGAPTGAKPTVPIEARSFDSLLDEARQLAAAGDGAVPPQGLAAGSPEAGAEPAAATRALTPLTGLGQVDRIENGSLRDLLAAPTRNPAPPADG